MAPTPMNAAWWMLSRFRVPGSLADPSAPDPLVPPASSLATGLAEGSGSGGAAAVVIGVPGRAWDRLS
jgi:hypothetical protein